jgi:uncharacterized protein YkwD
VSSTRLLLRLCVTGLAMMAGLLTLFPSTSDAKTDRVSREVVKRLNVERAKHGLPTYSVHRRLERAARSQSGWMGSHRSLAHGATGSGKARLSKLCKALRAKTVGETIGWIRHRSASKQAEAIVRWWMNSPPHREALMSPHFNKIGVGRRIGRIPGGRAVWFTADMAG